MIRGFFRNGAGFVKENLSGIGGSISTYVIEDASLIVGDTQMDIPVMVGRHPIDKMTKEELIKTLRIPSLLGRDVINKFKLVFDKEKEELTLE